MKYKTKFPEFTAILSVDGRQSIANYSVNQTSFVDGGNTVIPQKISISDRIGLCNHLAMMHCAIKGVLGPTSSFCEQNYINRCLVETVNL